MTTMPRMFTQTGDLHRLIASAAAAELPMPEAVHLYDHRVPPTLHMDAHGYAAWCEWANDLTTTEVVHAGCIQHRAEVQMGDVAFTLVHISDPIVVAS